MTEIVNMRQAKTSRSRLFARPLAGSKGRYEARRHQRDVVVTGPIFAAAGPATAQTGDPNNDPLVSIVSIWEITIKGSRKASVS
jgi:hypothetical protein